ncbi:MAG TPA: hypothetical protein DCR55_07380 [Lentisphaeria bacterium]|nr:hypothetical protein [Lentisphaeria bacterium]
MIPQTHIRTIVAGAIASVLVMAVYLLVVFPMQKSVKVTAANQKQQSENLRRSGFPLDPQKLRQLDAVLAKDKKKIYKKFSAVYQQVQRPLAREIDRYDTVENFCNSIQRFDYQEYYVQTTDELAKHDVHLYGRVLKLSENSGAEKDYHLLCHIWTVRSLALLARKHDLKLADEALVAPPPPEDASVEDQQAWQREQQLPPANIEALEVRSYATKADADAYVEEFPVRMTMMGTVTDLTRFLHDLSGPTTFLPLQQIEIEKIGRRAQDDTVKVTVVCSLFLLLRSQDKLVELGDGVLITKPRWRPGT